MANRAPTTGQIAQNILASFKEKFGQTISVLSKSFLAVTAKVMAGVYVTLYKYAGFLGQQMFIRYASAKETEINGVILTPLIEIGRQMGVSPPALALPAELDIIITVTKQTGYIAAGAQLLGDSNGVTYITIGSINLDAPLVFGQILAVGDQSGGNGAGIIGNLDIGAKVSFISPLANVGQQTEVVSTIQQGVDAEDIDTEYRQRVLDRRQKPPQGGAYADYLLWGEEINGIINIYPYTGLPGVVDVYAEATVASSGSADGIPTPAQLNAVYNSIQRNNDTELPNRRPVGAFVNVRPIFRIAFDIKIFDLDVDNSGIVKEAIEAALVQYFLSREPFITGLSLLPREDRITYAAVGGIVEEVVSSFNGVFGAVELILSGTIIPIYSLDEGQKAKLGEAIFI